MEPRLQVRNLSVAWGTRKVVEDIDFDIAAGETVALVGESGSGKSSIAKAILRLTPAGGRVLWRGVDLLKCAPAALRVQRRELQIIFQDPYSSLNPRMRIGQSVAEPLDVFEPKLSAAARAGRVDAMLERVGLSSQVRDRYPHEFSGGQCQRVGIARAMILQPRLLVCDEPVSALDVSIQGQIVNLLQDLQQETGMGMLFISHNLAVVRHLSHRVMVLHAGRLVETAACETLFAVPQHPHTQSLLAASLSRL